MIPENTEINQYPPESLNKEQVEAVLHDDGPMLISAGAGSGKTRTITERIVRLISSGVPGNRILAITFTNKAAQELRTRVLKRVPRLTEEELPLMGTFHSFGAKILREEAEAFERSGAYSIFDEDDSIRLIKKIIKSLNLPKDKYPAAKIRRDISGIKDRSSSAEELAIEIRRIFEEYESGLLRQNSFDFDDLIQKPVILFGRDKGALQKHRERHAYILVDEFQDVNSGQYALVRFLAEKHGNLNVVGDDNQSIFKFRGADFRNFLSFEKDWPGVKTVNLGRNYRSSGNIVAASAAVIGNNKQRRKKELWTDNPSGEPIRVVSAYGVRDEAEIIANSILRSPNKRSVAILYRTNAQSRELEQALSSLSIPYEIYGGLKFYERKEIKDIIAGMRYAINPRDESGLERLSKSLRRTPFRTLQEKLPEAAQNLSVDGLIEFFLKTADYENLLKDKFDNYDERTENINELIRFAKEFRTPVEFVERISLLQSSDRSSGGSASNVVPAVKMMTMHLSKGLEFDEVYLAGISEGLMPHERSLYSEEEVEEERRLMYVGMTRARKKLIISFYDLPSRFIYEIPDELLAADEGLPVIDEDGIIQK